MTRQSKVEQRRMRARRGLTLIEMIIAIIVMSIGVMALAGTATYVGTQMGGGRIQTIASAMSTKIADSLSSRRCPALVSGSQTNRGVTVTWTVTQGTPPRTVTVNQSVQYTLKRGSTKTVSYQMIVECPEFT
jgi:prepilin-type N-terminal cleavage/methylation domain-containing protein